MEYNFKEIESKWQRRWQEDKTYKVETDPSRPKFYVLDMFPYPSGAGLHVGHPLGYIASDIYSRYKRQKRLQRPASDGLRRLRPSGRTVRHPDGPASGRHHRAEHRPLPRAIGQNRLLVRLGPRSPHLRSGLLQMDAVGVPQNVRLLLLQRQAAGPPDRGAGLRPSSGTAPKG